MRDARVTEYIQGCAPFARPILRHLRKVIHDGGPGLAETIKWGMPTFLHKGKIVCGFAGFKAHCALWFWRGSAVVPKKPKQGMGNFGRITSLKDLPSAAQIKAYVKQAIARIDRSR
jgi:hypothetical protein